MNISFLPIKLRQLFKLNVQSGLNLLGLVVAISTFIIISHIVSFELSFDKFHVDHQDIYRVLNNRIYSNLNDESAGCPPATCNVISSEIEEVQYATRIKPLTNSIITISKEDKRNNFYHNNLFYADNTVFNVFSFEFKSGDPDYALSNINSAVVTEEFANKYFGSEDVIGKRFSCDNNESSEEYTITAILLNTPKNSYLDFDCLLSFKTLEKQQEGDRNMDTYWGWNAFNTYVKLKAQSNIETVHNKLSAIVEKYNLSNKDMTRIFKLQPLADIHLKSNVRHEIGRRNSADSIFILLGIALFILVVGWINYVNASSVKTRKELVLINVRKSLGSTNKHFVFENILESLVLNLVAILISILLVFLLSPLFANLHVELQPLSINRWMLVIGICVAFSLIAGIFPTILQFNLLKVFNDGNGGFTKVSRYRNSLVVFQFVLSIAFIIGTSSIIKQMNFFNKMQSEMNMENMVTLKTIVHDQNLRQKQVAFVDELKTISAIENVSVSSSVPGTYFTNFAGGIRQLNKTSQDGIKCSFFNTDEVYIDLYNVKMLAGERFAKQSSVNNNQVLINSTALNMLGFNTAEEAINKQIFIGELDGRVKTIRGVIDNFYHKALDEPINPTIINYGQTGSYISIKFSNAQIQDVLKEVKATWTQFFPSQPFDYHFNDKFYSAQYNKYKLFGKLVSIFAIIIISLSCIGLYSLARFTINNRIKEIGVRKVNGAKVTEVLAMLNIDFVKWVAIAFVIACPIAYYAMNKWLENFAYKTALSWWIFALAGVLALGIALLTVSWQSWRAATRNPVEALRYE